MRAGEKREQMLARAAKSGNASEAKQALAEGANTEVPDKTGKTPLLRASKHGNEGVVRLLLQNGANVRAVARDGRTCLHAAVSSGSCEVVRTLLVGGAGILLDAHDSNGRCPMDLVPSSRKDMSQLLQVAECVLAERAQAQHAAQHAAQAQAQMAVQMAHLSQHCPPPSRHSFSTSRGAPVGLAPVREEKSCDGRSSFASSEGGDKMTLGVPVPRGSAAVDPRNFVALADALRAGLAPTSPAQCRPCSTVPGRVQGPQAAAAAQQAFCSQVGQSFVPQPAAAAPGHRNSFEGHRNSFDGHRSSFDARRFSMDSRCGNAAAQVNYQFQRRTSCDAAWSEPQMRRTGWA